MKQEAGNQERGLSGGPTQWGFPHGREEGGKLWPWWVPLASPRPLLLLHVARCFPEPILKTVKKREQLCNLYPSSQRREERLCTLEIFTWLQSQTIMFYKLLMMMERFSRWKKRAAANLRIKILLFCKLASVLFRPCCHHLGFHFLKISTFIYFLTPSHHL